MTLPVFTCSLGCCGGVLSVGVVEYENVGLPEAKTKNFNIISSYDRHNENQSYQGRIRSVMNSIWK